MAAEDDLLLLLRQFNLSYTFISNVRPDPDLQVLLPRAWAD
jgi:hypothetical protein